jgi:hypothetical protein
VGKAKAIVRRGVYLGERSPAMKETPVKKLVALLALALAVPSLALAAKPPAPGNSQNSHGKAPQVLYVLKGTLTAYTNPGSVTIHVAGANHYRSGLKGMDLMFSVDSSTKVAVVTVGHKGIVKVRAAKKIATADLVATLQAQKAVQVVDQGATS